MNVEPEVAALEAEEAANSAGDELPDERDPFKRRVAVVLAVLGVLGAWIGVLRMDSANQEAFYARQTTRTAVGAMAANLDQETLQGLAIDIDAEDASLNLSDSFDPARREQMARSVTLRSQREALQRKALAETRVGYNNRTSQFETVLTTLAVALFLVGFTLVLNRRTRPPVLVPGLILAAYVAGWALWIHAKEIPTTPPDAIDAAAEAGTNLVFGEFKAAADGYTLAIEADADFLPAYNGRAVSAFLVSNPSFADNLAIVDTTTPEAELAAQDAETAVQLGEGTNFNALLLSGVFRFHDGDYDGAASRMRQAIEVNADAPEAYLNLAAAELAQGDQAAALTELAAGVALLDPAADSSEARQLAADLFTLLEQVEAAEPNRADDVDEVRTLLVAGETQLALGPLDSTTLGDSTVSLGSSSYDDGTLSFTVAYEGLPNDSHVAVYAFEQPTADAAYAQRAELARFDTVAGTGSLVSEATFEPACTPVAFRYDVYINGNLARSFDAKGGTATC